MFDLPAELALRILSFLPLSSLSSIQRVSHHWRKFFNTNESFIYHNAAVYHGYIPSPGIPIGEARAMYSERALGSALDWKAFCASVFHRNEHLTHRIYQAANVNTSRIVGVARLHPRSHRFTARGIPFIGLKSTKRRDTSSRRRFVEGSMSTIWLPIRNCGHFPLQAFRFQ